MKRARTIAFALYQNAQTAKSVLIRLKKKGLTKSSLIERGASGDLKIQSYLPSQILWRILAWFVLSLFLLELLHVHRVAIAFTGFVGLLSFLVYDFYLSRIDRNLLRRFKNLLVDEEILIIVQMKSEQEVSLANTLLRDVESGHPTFYLLRPRIGDRYQEIEKSSLEPLTSDKMQDLAKKSAQDFKKVRLQKGTRRLLTKKLKHSEKILRVIRYHIEQAERLEQSLTQSSEWILDNSYVIQGNIEEVRRNLPQNFYQELPKLMEGPFAGYPRIYVIAKIILEATGNRLTHEGIIEFLKQYQEVDFLTMGELWALPLLLRLRLIENLHLLGLEVDRRFYESEVASFWGNRLLSAVRREPERLPGFIAALMRHQPKPSPHFAQDLLDHLFDEETLLPILQKWFEDEFQENLSDILAREQTAKVVEQTAISNSIVSLITLSQLSWRDIFEEVSQVDKILAQDPLKTYSEMDFFTRDTYRHAVEKVAKNSSYSEIQVAQKTLELTQKAKQPLKKHVGYYLIDKGRSLLEKNSGVKPKINQRIFHFVYSHSNLIYLGSILALGLGLVILLIGIQAKLEVSVFKIILFTLFSLFSISELSIQLVQVLLSRFIPPFVLPKFSYEKEIPAENKTLVVIPTMLSDALFIKEIFNKLEIYYLANQDKSLYFGVLFDFLDSSEAKTEKDQTLLDLAIREAKALESKYGEDKFFLFIRERVWSKSENAWIGWERKRGKLESLNLFLMGEPSTDLLISVGRAETLKNTRYVITLDADTQLPKDAAKKMIATIAHPLNIPEISAEGKVVRGFTIIQPRVSTGFLETRNTLFANLFAEESSVDPYSQSVSNLYHDLLGEANYHGKGIYDVKAFHQILSGFFPEEHLLSHDLIEGNFVKVAHASDICLFDSFPQNYQIWSKRQHRWIRGDWQIIDWLFSRIPTVKGKRKNILNLISRWKIFDNLRRALLPVMSFVLLLFSWFFTSYPLLGTFVVLISLCAPFLSLLLNQVLTFSKVPWIEYARSAGKAIVSLVLLPHQAYLSLDALIRVIYRRSISKRHLLEWTTINGNSVGTKKSFYLQLFMVIPAILIMLSVIYFYPSAVRVAVPICLLWIFMPALVYFLDKPISRKTSQEIPETDQLFLRKIARKTWRYFDDFVGTNTHWLPPDNYQSALLVELAQRTSPTNIGLWLCCALGAYDLKYITFEDALNRIASTFRTLNNLEVYEGHLLNWYDTQTLKPLYPRYVSTVDSGNFIACLWTVAEGLKECMSSPLFPKGLFESLQDTVEICCEELSTEEIGKNLRTLKQFFLPGQTVSHTALSLQNALKALQEFLERETVEKIKTNYWLKKLEMQLLDWNQFFEKYFSWLREFENVGISSEFLDAYASSMTLETLASEEFFIKLEQFLSSQMQGEEERKTLLKLQIEFLKPVQQHAVEKIFEVQSLLHEVENVSNRINMNFLYSPNRKLFSIGFHVDNLKLDSSFYDLLASEARIASLVAIAKGDVAVDHWWSLGRAFGKQDGKEVLLSWGGTMFEYMMPLLFNHYYPDSLLGEACREAVSLQILYGKKRGIPWGISEAAFSEIDLRKTYQYRSFGVPGLGLKRGLEDDLVVSPYSTALALATHPLESIANLKEFLKPDHDLFGAYGFYESIDFARQQGPQGRRGVIIYAFMAHHQGMTFLALNNFFLQRVIAKRFHNDARIAGIDSLLWEKVPMEPAIAKETRKDVPISRLSPFSTIPILGVVDTPHSAIPKLNLLSNGSYSVMLTNSGGGYSRWKEINVTRWTSDSTSDDFGSFCYIKDRQTGAFWSTSYHPTESKGKRYSVRFKSDKIEYQRRDSGIEATTEVVISSEDDAEIRLISLLNMSKRTRYLELTSYQELALAAHKADRTHPVFNKLFIQTERLPDIPGLLAFRRLRSAKETPLYAIHSVASSHPLDDVLQWETDRNAFIGRGRSLARPQALIGDLTDSLGFVLDPIFSLRYRLTLQPGEQAKIAFITGMTNSRDQAIEYLKKYADISFSYRALEMAWTYSQLELRHLKIHQEEAQLFQKLASRILFPHRQLRPPTEQLKRNRKNQSHLWPYGISGDLPIVTVSISEMNEVEFAKQMLTAHAFWSMRGLRVDLIILNEEATGYQNPLFEQLRKLIESHSYLTGLKQPGGVYLLNSDQLPKEDLLLIYSVSRANLTTSRGSLRQQIVSPAEELRLSARLVPKRGIREEISKPLSFLELSLYNGYGGYSKKGEEYIIFLEAGKNTPSPWINVLSNPQFGTLSTESGLGTTWFGNSQSNRLTPWSNDPLLNPISDTLYIRDNELGVVWTPTPAPVREMDPYRIRHGQGYTIYEHNSHNIEQELLVFVPVNDEGGLPLRIQRLRLKNGSLRKRSLSVFAYTEWVLGNDREDTQMHVLSEWDLESQSLFAFNYYNSNFPQHVAFSCSNLLPISFTANRTEFLGRNGHRENPAALKRKTLSGTVGGGYDPCAALQFEIELFPGEEKELFFLLGYASDQEAARKLILGAREPGWIDYVFWTTKDWWNKTLSVVQIETPDPATNFSFNRWFLYQNISCRYWGRSGFYQSSGAYGFRDQLQDAAAFVYTMPQMTREHILRAASRQFLEGDVQHWWDPLSGAGVRTRISDDLLWLPYVIAHYVRVTHDLSILEEKIPFLKADLLQNDQEEAFFIPQISEETATLLEHCRRAIYKGLTTGPHGLPLMGGGDWNDGMNRVGIHGKGESVWLAWFLVQVLHDFSDLLVARNEIAAAEGFRAEAKRLANAIENSCWDGNWYARAFFDDGTPLGSKRNSEAYIDSLSQSWSIISRAGDLDRSKAAMQAAEEFLVDKEAKIVRILTPPFDKTPLDPGYIKGYPPGVRENGGQYTHGSLWFPMAFARMGNGDKAVEYLQMMHSCSHALTKEEVEKFKVEPYVVVADIYSLPDKVGHGGWSWYTGAAGWMYRIWLEEIFGFKLRGNVLGFEPVLPHHWDKVKIRYRYQSTTYDISIENPLHLVERNLRIELDNQQVEKGEIHLVDDRSTHNVRIIFIPP